MTQKTVNLQETTKALLETLDARSQDVIARRYGLSSGEAETLESIGREYGITRERVRQIQAQAKRILVELKEMLEPVNTVLEQTFAEHGGILTESHAAAGIRRRLNEDRLPGTVVVFYLDVLPPYHFVSRDKLFAPHWRHSGVVDPRAEELVLSAREFLKKEKHPVSQEVLWQAIRTAVAAAPSILPDRFIEAQLVASKHIERTPFGEWGLAGWAETNPRGVGDKAYAVLRRHQKPEHFTRITELINEAKFDHKRANPQTVHNELIKDDRFVLVGRGLYGLKEWGYMSGTVADVIESLLVQAGKPLTRDEVIKQVLAQRQVKKNTILLGLQNPQRFVRTPENRYTLKSESY